MHARARTNRHVCVWGARERDFFHKMQTATCWILKCYYHKNRHFIEPIAYSICSWFEFLNFVGVLVFFRIHSLLCYCKMLQFKLFNVHLAAFFENDFSILFLTRRRLFGNITKCWEKKGIFKSFLKINLSHRKWRSTQFLNFKFRFDGTNFVNVCVFFRTPIIISKDAEKTIRTYIRQSCDFIHAINDSNKRNQSKYS